MTRDEMLIGWLCFMDHNFHQGIEAVNLPNVIQNGLVEKGWLKIAKDENWKGQHEIEITPEGAKVADLESPAWGIAMELETSE